MYTRFLAWIRQVSQFQKRAPRVANPRVAAYYWDGGRPTGKPVKNLSLTGVYLTTAERWYVGTIVTLTLEDLNGTGEAISVPSRIVRHGEDGVGLEFMVRKGKDQQALKRFMERTATRQDSGQAMLEYALMFPLLLFLAVNAVNFGGFLYGWITVANAARSGTQYAILGGASVGSPAGATATQIQSLIVNDISSLPNGASLSVKVCTNNNGTVASSPSGGTCPPDPEAPTYVLAAIDVTYTYQPLIPAFDFPNLGFSASNIFAPTQTVHRRAYMRMIQ